MFLWEERSGLVKTGKLLSLICSVTLLLPVFGCSKLDPSKATQHTENFDVEIVYKRNQICYAVSMEESNTSLYSFNAAGLPVYAQDGSASTASMLKPGMCVSVKYDGYLLETYPAQFSGVTEVTINASNANDVEYLAKQISGMFPSTSPSDISRWDISFQGVSFLSEREKVALKHILSENWGDANISIDAEGTASEGTGHILVQTDECSDTSLLLSITVDTGKDDETPMTRTIQATRTDGAWTNE